MTNEELDETKKQLEVKKLEREIQNLDKANRWNLVSQSIPVITALIAVSGFLFGILQYNAQQRRDTEKQNAQQKRDSDMHNAQQQKDNDLREKEFKRRYWEKQLEVYSDMSQSAARLASLNNAEEREREYQRFQEMYYGSFLMFADEKMAIAGKNFFQTYIDYLEDPRDPKMRDKTPLQLSSKELAKAGRNSLSKTWDVPLKDLNLSEY